jgi:hypothetical protein
MVLNYITFLELIIFYVAPGNFAPLHNTLFYQIVVILFPVFHFRKAPLCLSVLRQHPDLWSDKGGFTHSMPCPCRAHAIPMPFPCHAVR